MYKPARSAINVGDAVCIAIYHRRSRSQTIRVGIVQDILTRSETHPHGIKVRTQCGSERRET